METREDFAKFVEHCENASLQEKVVMYFTRPTAKELTVLVNFPDLCKKWYEVMNPIKHLKCVACSDFIDNHNYANSTCKEFIADNLTYIEKRSSIKTKERN